MADTITDYLFPGAENKKKTIKGNNAAFMNFDRSIGN